MRPVDIGTSACYNHLVRDTDCASNWGNDLPVLATPVLLWLAEITSMQVIADRLEETEMTVGYGHTASHLAATPQGWTVQVQARLTRVDNRLLYFDITARDDHDIVYTGEHVRAIVDRDRFVTRLHRKASTAAVTP